MNLSYLSIKWKAFILTSFLLSAVFAAFLTYTNITSQQQFQIGQEFLYQQNKQQLISLIELSAKRIQQLAGTVDLSDEYNEAVLSGDTSSFAEKIDEVGWDLQIDTGVEQISLFSRTGELLHHWGDDLFDEKIIQSVINRERPAWSMRCTERCLIYTAIPLLAEGDFSGVVALAKPLSDVMLDFQQTAAIHTGLLMDHDIGSENKFSRDWGQTLVALTNPEINRPILNRANELYRLDEMIMGGKLVEWMNEQYELRVVPMEGSNVILISNVTKSIDYLNATKKNEFALSAISLVIAEAALLLLLWRPMTRLRETAGNLPLLAKHKFDEAKKSLSSERRTNYFRDESDLLNDTALMLCHELEGMQKKINQYTDELERERDFVRSLLNTVHAIILSLDSDGKINIINKHGVKKLGFSESALKGMPFVELLESDESVTGIAKSLERMMAGDLNDFSHASDVICRDGTRLHVSWHHASFFSSGNMKKGILSAAIDITARKEAEEQLSWMANHDELTRLYNRRRFSSEIEHTMEELLRYGGHRAVMFVDLDEFKEVNDNSGHHIGDQMLVEVSNVLKAVSRKTDFVARLGGDEFAVILNEFLPHELDKIAERFCLGISAIKIQGAAQLHHGSSSIGLALIPEHGKKVDELLANADKAMYRAKAEGKNSWRIYDPQQDSEGS